MILLRLFMDSEFTSLNQNAQYISLGLVTESGRRFYAEFTDYDESKIGRWVSQNVIPHLELSDRPNNSSYFEGTTVKVKGDTNYITSKLNLWLDMLPDNVEVWSDCLAYDWVLFCELFGGAMKLHRKLHYIPYDICTLMLIKGVDPDVSREDFINDSVKGDKHNSLYDAEVIRACHDKLLMDFY